MAGGDPYNIGYADLLENTAGTYGIEFEVFDSGGGFLIAQARLEGGVWLWITDWDSGLIGLERRRQLEAEGVTVGYNVSLYPTDPADPQSVDGQTVLASVRHQTATATMLPQLVAQALAGLSGNEHHNYDAAGVHTVTTGIERC
ncbi:MULTISPECIES: hypothetical protein [Mycolicibacter]|uniref:Uncharacterized protein n=2 Tax=Mycolicibacter TaxID=1073531 RepID=A0ABU5XLG6_9MYCO|nr:MULTISPECIES: hypothetical protein [unclassified Mycolicibacter]MEB3023041.1 hypothetical protein [Mycolicibacter sp. MYC098]MEB3033551.1 hypothetical protein [Mycolicibacter sp. MYC340]